MNKKKGCFRLLCCVLSFSAFLFPHSIKTRRAFAEGGVSKAECVMEKNSRRILYELRGDVRLPMASTTKIVTAATVLSLSKDIEEKVVIPHEAEGVEGSSVYLKGGEEYSVKDLLYGLMLRSGNDCATALAYHVSGSIEGFSSQMNQTAQRAGALHSQFKNPHGLPCNGHYTTARDLTSITCYALQNLTFSEIVGTKYYAPCGWKNKNKMLYRFEGATGVKTGYTREAGRCLVSSAEREGMTLVCTVLGCSPMYERSSVLLEDAFDSYRYVEILQNEEVFSVPTGRKGTRGYVKQSYSYPLLKEEEGLVEYVAKPIENTQKGENEEEIIGQLEIYLLKRLLFSTNLYKL